MRSMYVIRDSAPIVLHTLPMPLQHVLGPLISFLKNLYLLSMTLFKRGGALHKFKFDPEYVALTSILQASISTCLRKYNVAMRMIYGNSRRALLNASEYACPDTRSVSYFTRNEAKDFKGSAFSNRMIFF